jgi:hypothetical protein
MIPGATAISAAAISGLPDDAYRRASAIMSMRVQFDGVAFSPYQAFVTDETIQKVYAVEITVRALRRSVTS